MQLSNTTRRTVLKTLGATAGIAGLATPAAGHDGGMVGHLSKVWAHTFKYTDPARAYADGYAVPGENGVVPLEDVTDQGHAVCGMGYHFVNQSLFGMDDPKKPQVLVYGVDETGALTLGAVEYIVPKAGPYETESPDLFGHDDGAEVWQEDSPQEGLWSMHVWIHAANPDGTFVPFNPDERFHPDGCIDPREDHDHE